MPKYGTVKEKYKKLLIKFKQLLKKTEKIFLEILSTLILL